MPGITAFTTFFRFRFVKKLMPYFAQRCWCLEFTFLKKYNAVESRLSDLNGTEGRSDKSKMSDNTED
jgi:hypothetical protein